MGVNYLVLQARTARLSIGGVPNVVGILRDTGKADAHTRGEFDAAATRSRGRRSPRAVLAFGYGEREDEAAVYGWEDGMSHTDDLDFSRLPSLGRARHDGSGSLVLYADSHATEPMTLGEAVAAGITGSDGMILERRRPRIVSSELSAKVAWTHRNPSSLGPVDEVLDTVTVRLDSGGDHEEIDPFERLSEAAREKVRQGALTGMTLEDAFRWMQANAARDWRAESAAVKVIADGRLDFSSAGGTAWMHPAYDDRWKAFGLLVGGDVGGAGYPQMAEKAFSDIGDRLAMTGPPEGIRCSDNGFLALEAGGMGILLTGFSEGQVGVAWGGPFPEAFIRATTLRQAASDGGRAGADALLRWEHERMIVPPEKVGVFLADFSLYLKECGGAAISPDRPIPSFRDYLDDNGISYGPATDLALPGPA